MQTTYCVVVARSQNIDGAILREVAIFVFVHVSVFVFVFLYLYLYRIMVAVARSQNIDGAILREADWICGENMWIKVTDIIIIRKRKKCSHF